MTFNFESRKIPVFTGVNDAPVEPTVEKAGNGAHLISLYNGFIDDVQAALNTPSNTSIGLITVPTDRIYYVSPTGSDNNNGTSDTTPFLTIQKAIDNLILIHYSS